MAQARRQPITDILLNAIRESGMSFAAIERETGLKRQSLMKFCRGEQSLRLDLADRLATYFGLELRKKKG
jgi:plasmid maintenance system antidote protein VapI